MTTALKEVMERAEQLEPDELRILLNETLMLIDALMELDLERGQKLAAELLKAIEDAVAEKRMAEERWEQAFKDQRGLDALHRMAVEAVAEYERGETEEGGFGE